MTRKDTAARRLAMLRDALAFRAKLGALLAALDAGEMCNDHFVSRMRELAGPQCSICRRRHGDEVVHACE